MLRVILRTWILAGLAGLFLVGCDQEPAKPPTADLPTPTATLPTPTATLPSAPTKPGRLAAPVGKGFDFYVLSLSWSPSYCEAEGENANRQQCASGRPYAFVVHGLWPQFERGYPSECVTSQRDVDDQTLRGLYDLMPSAGLIRHEWREHGTCSGLSQSDYFRVLRMAREAVTIPTEFRRLEAHRTLAPEDAEKAFVAANPGLSQADMAVTCDKHYLREIRICMGKDLGFRACPEIDRRACRLDRAVMPPVRGG